MPTPLFPRLMNSLGVIAVMKKLAHLGPQSEFAHEFDHRSIRRSAKALKAYLLGLDPHEDTYGLREKVLPIVEDALAGRLKLPFDDRSEPFRNEGTVGLLPREYMRISTPFWLHVTGGLSEAT